MSSAAPACRPVLFGAVLALTVTCNVFGYTKSGSVYTTNGSQADVNAALADSGMTAGDTVTMPAGTFTWGISGLSTTLGTSGVALTGVSTASPGVGAGTCTTIINMDPGSPSGYGAGLIYISAAATIQNIIVNGVGGSSSSPSNYIPFFVNSSISGWRITNLTWDATGGSGGGSGPAWDSANYVTVTNGTYGVIDHCTDIGAQSPAISEGVFSRGPSNSWQTPDSLGTASAIYVENCIIGGGNGNYVSDFNANSRAVVRFCTITSEIKVDGHGMASNSPARSFRQIEVYNNAWTAVSGYWAAMEIRGATGVIFNNTSVVGNSGASYLGIEDYSAFSTSGSFPQGPYPTTAYWAIPDQIGTGEDRSGTTNVTIGAGNPGTVTFPSGTFLASAVGSTIWQQSITATGTTPALSGSYNLTITGTNTATISNLLNGSGSPINVTAGGSGTVTWGEYSGGATSDPIYCWGNVQDESPWVATNSTSGASLTGFVSPNRDYYDSATSVSGVPGVSIGTYAQMLASSPAQAGLGWWATDQGNWNTENNTPDTPGYKQGQGELFVWSGNAWVLKYEPYTYPYSIGLANGPSNLSISSP